MLHVLPHAHILTSWFLLCMHRRRHPGGDFACSLGGECLSGQAQQRCARFPQTQTHTWPCLSLLSLPHALRTMSCCMCTGAIIEAVTSRAVLDEIENQAGLMFNMATPSIAPSRAAPLAALDAPRCVCWGCGRPLTGHRCLCGLGPDFFRPVETGRGWAQHSTCCFVHCVRCPLAARVRVCRRLP